MTHLRFAALCALLAVGLASPVLAQPAPGAPVQVQPPAPNAAGVLTNANGMTLYVFKRDGIGSSSCTATPCTTNWPALLAPGDARPSGDFSLIMRPDGTRQWALNGQPLYLWKNDKKPGDTTGNGVAGNWFTAKAPQ